MIFDNLGLPKEIGADDWQDSARLAGLMMTIGWPQKITLRWYVFPTKYVRHPKEIIYNFSRDQALCLMAGLNKVGLAHLVDRNLVDGKDWFTPSHMGHVSRCRGNKANWFQNLWLIADILFHAKVTPKGEPNQLICMMIVAGNWYVRLWKKHNKHWKESITSYWCGWRQEIELAQAIVNKIDSY